MASSVNKNPLVSIITISYNSGHSIEQTIQSVLSQSYSPIEYIIIDGGSTDHTVSLIKKYADRLSYWVSEKDNGISDAFNKGLHNANGEIIGIINADDWYETDTIEKIVTNFGDADVVYGDLQLWKNNKREFIQFGRHEILNREMSVNHPTVFVKKYCYDKVGYFSEDYKCAMDYDILLRLYTNNFVFKHIPIVTANMRLDGFSDANWFLGCKETLRIKNIYLPNKKFGNYLYFLKHVLAIATASFFKKSGLRFVTKLYRSRFSQQKKVY